MSTTRFTVYVDLPVLATERHCLVIVDEADLKQQLAEREAALRTAPYVAKPQRDKQGKLITYQLNKDWDLP
jgi:hypothetical protein